MNVYQIHVIMVEPVLIWLTHSTVRARLDGKGPLAERVSTIGITSIPTENRYLTFICCVVRRRTHIEITRSLMLAEYLMNYKSTVWKPAVSRDRQVPFDVGRHIFKKKFQNFINFWSCDGKLGPIHDLAHHICHTGLQKLLKIHESFILFSHSRRCRKTDSFIKRNDIDFVHRKQIKC